MVQTTSKHILWLISAQKGRPKFLDWNIEISPWSLTTSHWSSKDANFGAFFFKIQGEAIVCEIAISAHLEVLKIIIVGL